LKKWGGGKILIATLFAFTFLSTTAVFGQSNNAVSCGTPDFPPGTIEALLQKYSSNNSATPESSIAPRIPVWIYFFRASGGGVTPSESAGISAVQGMNTYFNGLFSFSICGTTNIVSDDFAILEVSEFGAACDLVNSFNEPLDDKCIKIFFVSNIITNANTIPPTLAGGYGISPNLPGGNFDKSGIILTFPTSINAAHEMGHYFGLSHTFLGGQINQFVIPPNTTNTDLIGICSVTGDFLCDTPADLSDTEISFASDCVTFTCGSNCLDPLGVPYAPDPTLLMSYHGDCRNRFSNGQRVVMSTLFQFAPNYAKLRDPNAACTAAKFGKVIANCLDLENDVPLEGLDIELITSANNFPCNVITDPFGIYKISSISGNCQQGSPGKRVLTPQKDLFPNTTIPKYLNLLNGVDVYDLVLISRHILNLEPLNTPYKLISADANNSGTVTTFDNVILRKAILGSITSLPAGSWRHIPNLWFNLPGFSTGFNSSNPFGVTFQDIEGIQKSYLGNGEELSSWMDKVSFSTSPISPSFPASNLESSWSFTGTKVGDVDCNALPGAFSGETPINAFLPPTGGISIATTANTTKTIKVVLNTPKAVSGWQMGINYNLGDLTIGQVTDGNEGLFLNADNFYKSEDATAQKGKLNALWFSENGTALNLNNKVLFTFVVNAKSNMSKLETKLDLNQFAAGLKFYDNTGNLIKNIGLRLEESNGLGLGNNNLEERAFNLEPSADMDVQVSPVPFSNALWFAVNMPFDESATLSIFDMTGRLMLQNKQLLQKGRNDFEMDDLSDFPAGVYTYILKAGTLSKVGKLIK
jgi:hypothetical protein